MFVALARAGVACVLFLCASAGTSATEAVNPEGELPLAKAIECALRSNPELVTSSYELTATQARLVQAGSRPNPEIGVELENFAGSGSTRGIDSLETTLSLSQVIELGGKRNLRISAAEAAVGLTDVAQRARELDILGEVTRRFIDVIAAQERRRFASESAGLAQKTLEAIAMRVDAARSPEAERSRARIGVTRAQIELRQADSELRSARYALAATWGAHEPAFTTAQADLFKLEAVRPFPALIEQLEQSPDFVRFASESRLRDAELRLARAQARPDLSLSLGVRRIEESDDTALVAGFSMPLPMFDRNRGTIQEAQIRLTQTEAAREAYRVRTLATLFSLYQEMNAVRARVETLREQALPQAQLALDQTQSGYDRGRFSYLELITAQQELLALRAATIDAATEYHQLLAEIERLTSASLTRATP